MRAILVIAILAVVAIIAGVATGLINTRQTRTAEVPRIEATSNGIVAKGGRTPQFDVETGTVAVGTRNANVAVPQVRIEKGQTNVRVPAIEVRRPADATTPPAAPAPANTQ